MDKPFDEADFSQNYCEIMTGKVTSVTGRSAMYCLKQDLLVAGKLGKPIVSNDEVTLYQVVAADARGFNAGSFFHAVKGRLSPEHYANPKVWVLNKEEAIFLDELADAGKGSPK